MKEKVMAILDRYPGLAHHIAADAEEIVRLFESHWADVVAQARKARDEAEEYGRTAVRVACHKVAEDHYLKHEKLASKNPEVAPLSQQQMVAAGEIGKQIRDRSSPRI